MRMKYALRVQRVQRNSFFNFLLFPLALFLQLVQAAKFS